MNEEERSGVKRNGVSLESDLVCFKYDGIRYACGYRCLLIT